MAAAHKFLPFFEATLNSKTGRMFTHVVTMEDALLGGPQYFG